MRRVVVTAVLVLSVGGLVIEARAAGAPQFAPADAAQAGSPAVFVASESPAPTATATTAPIPTAAVTVQPSDPSPEPTVAPTPAPTVRPVVATAAPRVAIVAPTVAPPAPTATSCAAGSWFCYPRLGIAGAIVPYTDCTGSTDVGTQIRSFACLSDHYLMGHAYTQFGKITSWQVGDVVVAYGQSFTVTGAFVQSACTQARFPLAPLEMQTSLTPNACGDVLVVQAH